MIFVSPELYALVAGPWGDKEIEHRANRLRADFDMFITGSVISVGQDPYKKKKNAYMSSLDPTEDEVWEIRSRDPKPGIRVFGRFTERDVFVALNWAHRDKLGGPQSREFRDERERCKAEWRKLFPSYAPHTGATPDDYISNIFLTQAELARRIGKRPEVVNRMLGSPGNWRIDTISDLLVGIAAEELDPKSVSLLNRAPRNQQYPEWLQENLSDAHRVSRTDIKRLTTSTSGKTISIQEKPSPGNRKILSTSAAG
jgi:hypothetical protein